MMESQDGIEPPLRAFRIQNQGHTTEVGLEIGGRWTILHPNSLQNRAIWFIPATYHVTSASTGLLH